MKKVVYSVLILGIVACLGYCGYTLLNMRSEGDLESRTTLSILPQETIAPAELDSLKQQNDDFVAYLHFDNNMINKPVVQASDNDYYLTHDFSGVYSSRGSIFMDSENTLTDDNLLIYGHHVIYDDESMFSPLVTFAKSTKEEIEDAGGFSLTFADGSVKNYEIAVIYEFDTDGDNDFAKNYYYNIMNFYSDDLFNKWLEYPLSIATYVCDTPLTREDNYVTFYTCKEHNTPIRVIIIGREIEVG